MTQLPTREDQSLATRWHDFQQLDRLREHWYWRPEWNASRSFFTWHLTFDGASDLHQLVRQVQDQLGTPAVDLVPLAGLHLTMQGVGFTDEVSDADVGAIVSAAADQLRQLPPFDLTLGPVDPDHEGIGLLLVWPTMVLAGKLDQVLARNFANVPEAADYHARYIDAASDTAGRLQPAARPEDRG